MKSIGLFLHVLASVVLLFSARAQNAPRVVQTVAELIASDPRTFATSPVFTNSNFTAVVTTLGGSTPGEGMKTWRWNYASSASTNTYAQNGPLAYPASPSVGRWEYVPTVKELSLQAQIDAAGISGGPNPNSVFPVSSTNYLRALTAAVLTNYAQVHLGGYFALGDGGSGFLTVDLTDTTTADDGGYCFVVDGIRLKADFGPDNIPIKRWGARSGRAYNSHPAIQSAIDYAWRNLGGEVDIPVGDWWIGDTIKLKTRVSLRGQGVSHADGVASSVFSTPTTPSSGSTNSYRRGGNSVIVLGDGVNKPMLEMDPTNAYVRIDYTNNVGGTVITTADGESQRKFAMSCGIRGIVWDGNGDNQTRYDCHALKIMYSWGVSIEDNLFRRYKGHMMFLRENNEVLLKHNFAIGQQFWSKGVFLYSCADYRSIDNGFGAASGPIVWATGAGSWVSSHQANFYYNAQQDRYTNSGAISADTITISGTHQYETGMPVEVVAGSGGTIPTGTVEPKCYFAIKVSSSQLKLADSYEKSLAGTAKSISGGSGEWYVWHGPGSGLYLSDGVQGLTVLGNRMEQHYSHGILCKGSVFQCVFSGNILPQEQYDTRSGLLAVTNQAAAGIKFEAGARDNIVANNVFFASPPLMPQSYGIWIGADAGAQQIGINTFTNIVVADVFNESTANTSTLVQQVGSTATVGNYLSLSPGIVVRGGTSGQWLQEWDRTNVVNQKYGVRLVPAFTIGDRSYSVDAFSVNTVGNTLRRLALGSDLTVAAPKSGRLTGENATGTDIAGADVRIEAGKGTGAGACAAIYLDTPSNIGSGATAQTLTTRLRANVTGVGIGGTTDNAGGAILQINSTTAGVLFPRMTTTQKNAISSPTAGTVVFDTDLQKLQVYAAGAWATMN